MIIILHNIMVYTNKEINVFHHMTTIYSSNPENLKIAQTYADWLSELRIKEESDEIDYAINKLSDLYKKFEFDQDIAETYVLALVKFTRLNIENYCSSLNRLYELATRHNDDILIVYEYIKELCIFSGLQDPGSAIKMLQDLKNIKIVDEFMNDIHSNLISYGLEYYEKKDFRIAEALFFGASIFSSETAEINLAYMTRRKEGVLVHEGEIEGYLEHGIGNNDPFAIVNYSLYQAVNNDDWDTADLYMHRLEGLDIESVIKWWSDLYKKGEAEGLLVLVWLDLIGLMPYKLNVTDISILKSHYSNAPEWIVCSI